MLLLLAIATAVFVGRRFAHPIKLLAAAAEAIRADDFDAWYYLASAFYQLNQLDKAVLAYQVRTDCAPTMPR